MVRGRELHLVVTGRELHLVVPGPLDQRTGGYLYDARMAAGLRARGWTVAVHALDGVFPDADARAEASLDATLAALPAGATVLLDGLGVGALPHVLQAHAPRLRLLALVHHPLADETGLSAADGERLALLERRALAACRGVIVTSGFTAGRLDDAYHVPAERIRAVPPGTEPAPAARGPAPGEPPRLLCVGSVTPRKGHHVLVAALERISDLPWSCVCAGSLARAPDFAEGVLSRVRSGGLAGRIEFPGECDEEALGGLYHAASVFVLPSYFEGYGMALVEALARGIPVVSTRAGAIPDTVSGAGILVEPGDSGALAGALRALLEGPEGAARRDGLAAVALRHGMALPDWDEAAADFERAVTELSMNDGGLRA